MTSSARENKLIRRHERQRVSTAGKEGQISARPNAYLNGWVPDRCFSTPEPAWCQSTCAGQPRKQAEKSAVQG